MGTLINGVTLGHGVNLQPSYYNNGHVNFGWDFMKQHTAIQSVRIEIEPGKELQAASWINQARSHDLQVVATYHKSTVLGTDNAGELLAAAQWWKENYQKLGGGFIINLMNEWGSHQITAADYAGAYNQALAVLREAYKGPVIIDLPGWGQDAHTAFVAVTSGQPAIKDTGIVLSAHIYPGSWNSYTGQSLSTDDLDELQSAGLPCIVGEFGTAGGGTGDWSGCVAHAISKGWTAIGWCWNGDGHGFNMAAPSWNHEPQATVFSKSAYFDTIYNLLASGA